MEGYKPLVEEESQFLKDWNDLIAPDKPMKSGLIENFVSSCAAKLHSNHLLKVSQLL